MAGQAQDCFSQILEISPCPAVALGWPLPLRPLLKGLKIEFLCTQAWNVCMASFLVRGQEVHPTQNSLLFVFQDYQGGGI